MLLINLLIAGWWENDTQSENDTQKEHAEKNALLQCWLKFPFLAYLDDVDQKEFKLLKIKQGLFDSFVLCKMQFFYFGHFSSYFLSAINFLAKNTKTEKQKQLSLTNLAIKYMSAFSSIDPPKVE